MRGDSLTARLYGGALVGLVVLFSIASFVAMAFRHAEISRAENRTLAQLPAWPRTLAQWEAYPQQFDAYFNDNFGLRRPLLRLNSSFTTVMLGRLPSDKVIFGKDQWLFYAGEESLELYRNERPLSAIQLDDAREALARRVRRATELKARYVFFLVPDKHTIYPEKMPSLMTRRDRPSQFDQLMTTARAAGLPVVDVRPALLRGKAEGLVYYKDDTHWTHWGAYLGYRAVMQAVPLPDLPVLQLGYEQFSVATEFAGGLAGMANLPWVERTVTSDPSADRCAVTQAPLQQVETNIVIVRSRCGNARGKVVYVGDSFTEQIMKYLAQSFGEVVFVMRSGFTPFSHVGPYIAREAPDLVIEQLVERHAASIADSLARE